MSDVVVYRKRRGVELSMLVFALALPFAGYLLTEINLHGQLPALLIPAALVWTGIGLAAHFIVRWRWPYADPLLLPCAILLNGLGIAMIHRLDQMNNPIQQSAERQLVWTVIALVGFAVTAFVLRDYRILKRFPYLMFLAGMVVLLLPMVPGLGKESHGARIWIHIGPYDFQPAELAKLLLVIAFASYLVDKREVLALAGTRVLGFDLPRIRDLGPILIMWLASIAVMVFQKDLGTSMLFFGLFVAMLYLATERPSWPIFGAILFLAGAYGAYLAFDHVKVRVSAWLFPFADWDKNYQIIVAQFGMAWGGLIGTGWGQGRPGLVPVAKSDMIFAAFGEELGVTGMLAIVLVYGLIVARGLRMAIAAKDPFGKLLAAGLAFVFALQVFTIIGGVTRLLPLTGLTTPFASQGGSSLVANYLLLALMLLISHQVRRPELTPGETPVVSLADDRTQVISTPAARVHAQPAPAPPASVSPPAPASVTLEPSNDIVEALAAEATQALDVPPAEPHLPDPPKGADR